MTKYLLLEGRFALGILLGCLAALFALLALDAFDIDIHAPDELIYAVAGALIAGIIGVIGQIIVIISNESLERDKRHLANKASLQKIFTKTVKILNLFLQIKRLAESSDPKDNITLIGWPSIIKPIFASDNTNGPTD